MQTSSGHKSGYTISANLHQDNIDDARTGMAGLRYRPASGGSFRFYGSVADDIVA